MAQSAASSRVQPVMPVEGSPIHLRDVLHDTVGCLRTLYRTYGTSVAFTRDQARAVFAFGPETNRQLFCNPDLFYVMSGFPGPKNSAHRRFGRGLFGLNGEEHQRHRRLLMPPFRKEAVESCRDAFVGLTETLLAQWQDGQVLDMAHEMKEFALRITGQILFGLDDLSLAHAIEGGFEDWMECSHAMFFSALLPIDRPERGYEDLLESAERLEVNLRALVQQKRAAPRGKGDVLAILVEAHDAGLISEADVIGELHTLFNAAYHTTTSALTWTLLLLAQHPSVMADLLDELDHVLAGAAPTVAQLAQLPLLDRVIRESLRVLTPVVYYPRMNLEPTALGPYFLPKGTLIIASHYVTHHLREIYPQPERFLPDRWLHQAPTPYTYMPFGGGVRMCIGAPFALLMLKICVAVIAQRFRLTVVPGTRIDRQSTLTLGPREALPMMIRRQDRQFSTSPVQGNIHDLIEFPPYADQQAVAA